MTMSIFTPAESYEPRFAVSSSRLPAWTHTSLATGSSARSRKKDASASAYRVRPGRAMGCDFCATGRLGLTRSLELWEIVAQFAAVR